MELKKIELRKFFFFSVSPFFPCKNYDPPPQSCLEGWGVCINLFCIGNFCIRLFLNIQERLVVWSLVTTLKWFRMK